MKRHLTMHRQCAAFLLIFLAAWPLIAKQTNGYAEEIKRFEEFVHLQMKVDKIPGLSIGFIKDDFSWTKGFGFADLENKIPATAESAYRLASNTKSMTAAAVLQLAEKGKIDLDAEAQTYVPYFPRKRWPVTVRQLLGHLGGISHYKNYDVEGHIKEHKDTRASLDIFAHFDLAAEPGTTYNYSSYGYNLLGAVIEGAAKEPYGTYLRKNLWEPLGMNRTTMDDPNELIPGRVKGYRIMDGELKNSEFVDISSRFAAGGTRSTVIDLLKYARGLSTENVLSKKSIDLMYTSMVTKDGRFIDYGMGWRVRPVNGRFHVYHTGGQPETRTLLVRFPQENFAIALAYNLEGGHLHAFSHRLTQLILDEPWNMPVYTGSKENALLYSGLHDVFNFGLCYFKRHRRPLTSDQKELAEAFDYFNAFVNPKKIHADFRNTLTKIADGRHPAANRAFVKIGAYMAAKLQEKFGPLHMETYHRMGAIVFFNDYVKYFKDLPQEQQFSKSLQKLITDWNRDWQKTCTAYTRGLVITPFSNLDQMGKNLKKGFAGAKTFPDFTSQFADVTEYFYINDLREKAFKTAHLAVELYPSSLLANTFLANTYACFGRQDKALHYYKQTLKINPAAKTIGAVYLNYYANRLIYWGQLDKALKLLTAALQLYPGDANLCNTTAEVYIKIGRKYLKKALEMDPSHKQARETLKKIGS